MCFFACLALPLSDVELFRTIPHSFEVLDVTDWSIGRATYGREKRDRSFLITSGGCSCFISDKNHRSDIAPLDEFKSLVERLLQHTPYLSILVHNAGGDLRSEIVNRKARRSVSYDELFCGLDCLELDVRYVTTT